MSNIKFHQKIPLGRSPFLRYRVFWCILLVTGLVTDLKHRVMVMLWKIFVGLTYHIVMFNADIMNFMACALFPVVFRELLMFLSKFLPFWAKIILWNTYLATYTLPDNKNYHRILIIFDVLTMTELSTLSHDSWWASIKVYVWFSTNWNKKVALQMLTLPNSQAQKMNVFDALQMAELHIMLIDSFESYYSFCRHFFYLQQT